MILLSSLPSPFGRKVKIAAHHLGLYDQITTEQANPAEADPSLVDHNPLGKIPALILDDGTVLYDSRVIVEYLDSLSTDVKIFPAGGMERYKDLTLNALGDGILDAGILQVYEVRMRPEERRHQDWVDRQAAKISRSIGALEADVPSTEGGITMGHITLACALGYLDFRFNGDWRANHPNLVSWLDAFSAQVPGFDKTQPPPA